MLTQRKMDQGLQAKNEPSDIQKLIRRPLLLPMLAFQACATNGNSCLVWGSHLPILLGDGRSRREGIAGDDIVRFRGSLSQHTDRRRMVGDAGIVVRGELGETPAGPG